MASETLPGHAEQGGGIACPSCGAFVGALPRCPRCGARPDGRASLKVFRLAAVLLATAGLGILLLMARHREIPLVEVVEITQTMNFAYVRVAGHVVGEPRVYRQAGLVDGVRFTIDDGTGRIQVRATGKRARQLVDGGRMPRSGDEAELAGSLNVSAADPAIWLQVPEHLQVRRLEANTLRTAEVIAADEGRAVRVTGTVSRVRAPRPGTRAPWIVTLRDGGGSLNAVFFGAVYDDLPNKDALVAGAAVAARGTVGIYRDEVQLNIGAAADLVLLPPGAAPAPPPDARPAGAAEPAAPPLPPSAVDAALAGETVRVRGAVASLRTPREGSRAPWTLTLSDGEGSVPVVFWESVAGRLDLDALREGATVEVTAPVSLYRGAVQVKVVRSNQLRIVDAGGAGGEARP